MKQRHVLKPVIPVLGLALLAACNGQTPQGVKTDAVVNGGKASADKPAVTAPAAAAHRGVALGLVQPGTKLEPGQFQVLDNAGKPLAGAEVVVGDARLTTDALGVVTFPANLTDAQKQAVVIKADGFVGVGMDVLTGYAVKLTAVDPVRTPISATGGGTAMNSEGNMEVMFPPGALTGDAQVAVTRTFGANGLPGQRLPEQIPFKDAADATGKNAKSFTDAGYKLGDNAPFGTYDYAFDLGKDVQLAPGSSVVVKFKAEGAMAVLLKARYEAGDKFDTQSETVSRDAAGNFWLAMRVQGPSAVTGNGAADAGASAASQRRALLDAQCRTFNDVETQTFLVKKEWTSFTPGIEVPIWPGGFRTRGDLSANEVNAYAATSGGGCVSSWTAEQYEYNQYHMALGSAIPGWITLVTHNPNVNEGRCVYFQFDPNQYYCQNGKIMVRDPGSEWQTTYRNWSSKSINALVTWLSDDARVKGAVPGARVDFAHSLAPVRNNVALSVNTANDGYAETIGVENSYGTARASLAAEPWTYGSNAGYYVNCSTVGLNIVKMMPRVTVRATVRGAVNGATPLATTHGDFAYTGEGTVLKPSLPLNAASATFGIDGSRQPDPTTWVDATSNTVAASWNGAHAVATEIWVSRPLSTTLTYGSNDTDPSLPADQKPQLRWGGQAATGSTVLFTQAQSTYAKKNRNEPLSFSNVAAATAWGLNGTPSTIKGQHDSNGVSLVGQATGTVNGGTLPVALNADLPAVTLALPEGATGTYNMLYEITDAAGVKREATMKLKLATGNSHTFYVPVEEAVGNAGKHSFRIISLLTEDASHVLYMADKSTKYPTLANIHRGGTFPYPATFESGFISAK